jgi:hypothetical protein
MGIKESIMQTAAGAFLEGPGKAKSFDAWVTELEKSGAAIEQRMAKTKNPEYAQALLRHITGIERWGQSRLRVFLGAPFVRDEYEGYRPGKELGLEGQRAAFRETRSETIELVRQLQQANVPDSATVAHNDFGPLSARGWLRYLNAHASLESQKLRT